MQLVRLTYLATLVVLAGCSSTSMLRSFAPTPEPSTQTGLRYYLPRDVLHVAVTATYNAGRGWSKSTVVSDFCKPGDTTMALKTVAYELTQTTVPDRRMAYHLTMEPSQSAAQNFKLAVTNDGLLTSLNYSIEDKRAEIAGNVLKTVAGVGGTILGVEQMLPGGFRAAIDKPAPRTRSEKCALQKDDSGLLEKLLASRDTLESDLYKAVRERERGLQGITAGKENELKLLQSRDELQAKRIQVLDTRLHTVRDGIAAIVDKVKTDAQVIAQDTVVKSDAVIDVSALPSEAIIAGALTSLAAAHNALKSYPEVQRLLDSTRIVITIDEAAMTGAAVGLPATVKWKSQDCAGAVASDDCVHIYTRAPQPRVLRVYAPTGKAATDPFALREARLVSVVSAADAAIDIPIATKTLGQNTMSLVFARAGTLTGFEQASTAGLAAATGTLATALSGAREEFLSGLKSAQTTQSTLDAIKAESRANDLKALQDQKAILDAQLALQGTTASKDLVAQKQQLDAQIALLASQAALASSQQTNALTTELASLRAEIQRLQIQLELVKAQQELEKAKKATTNP